MMMMTQCIIDGRVGILYRLYHHHTLMYTFCSVENNDPFFLVRIISIFFLMIHSRQSRLLFFELPVLTKCPTNYIVFFDDDHFRFL